MRNLLAAALLASAALVAVPAQAQSTGADIHAGELELAINKSQIVTADRPIDRAMIGNDTIACRFSLRFDPGFSSRSDPGCG